MAGTRKARKWSRKMAGNLWGKRLSALAAAFLLLNAAGGGWARTIGGTVECDGAPTEMTATFVDENDDGYAERVTYQVGPNVLLELLYENKRFARGVVLGVPYASWDKMVAETGSPCAVLEKWRAGSPKGSRPTFPTVHRPKVNRSSGLG